MQLPPEAVERLRGAQAAAIEIGDVFWLPATLMRWFPSEKARPCLVVAVEQPAGDGPAIAHLVAGTTNRNTRSHALVVPAGTIDLTRETRFSFKFSTGLPTTLIVKAGESKGRLGHDWHDSIGNEVRASRLSVVKQLWT